MSKYLSPKLETVTPYTPGEQPQDQQYIKLNTNESPYLPSPAVVAAVSEHEVEKLRLYSDPVCTDLLKTAAAHFGLQPDQIMPGNGSDENLFFALRAFCDETHPLAYADITYGCYSVWCGLMHIPSHIIPQKEDFTLDPADYYGLNETIVIANPNAPTGLALPRSAIEGILKANPDNVVIVDEAYVDFGGESCVPLIDRYDNLLLVGLGDKSCLIDDNGYKYAELNLPATRLQGTTMDSYTEEGLVKVDLKPLLDRRYERPAVPQERAAGTALALYGRGRGALCAFPNDNM